MPHFPGAEMFRTYWEFASWVVTNHEHEHRSRLIKRALARGLRALTRLSTFTLFPYFHHACVPPFCDRGFLSKIKADFNLCCGKDYLQYSKSGQLRLCSN